MKIDRETKAQNEQSRAQQVRQILQNFKKSDFTSSAPRKSRVKFTKSARPDL